MCLQGAGTGQITISANGGRNGFTYAVSGKRGKGKRYSRVLYLRYFLLMQLNNTSTWQISGVFNQVAAGTYTCYAQDASGCIASTTAIVNTNNGLVFVFNFKFVHFLILLIEIMKIDLPTLQVYPTSPQCFGALGNIIIYSGAYSLLSCSVCSYPFCCYLSNYILFNTLD